MVKLQFPVSLQVAILQRVQQQLFLQWGQESEQLDQSILVDHGADQIGGGCRSARTNRSRVMFQETKYLGEEGVVTATLPSQKGFARGFGAIESFVKEIEDPFMAFLIHGYLSYCTSWLLSQAMANRMSFFTVSADIPMVSAVSRMLSPPKYRRSMIRA